MKTKKLYVLFVVGVILALLMAACAPGNAPSLPSFAPKNAEESTPVPGPAQESAAEESTGKTDPDGGMLDVGELLTPKVTAEVSGMIEWSLDEHVWGKYPGLEAPEVAYYDTGVSGETVLESMPGLDGNGIVLPEKAVLICGGTDGKLVLNNGYSLLHSGGFYFALTPGTQVNSIWLKNGFCLVVDERYGYDEYAARISQAISSNWDYAHVYKPADWPEIEGVYATPLNILRVGADDGATPTP